MLEQLVKEICAGGTLETQALAARLGTSPRLVQAMLEHLQRAGVIRSYVDCGEGCQGCGLSEACNTQKHSTVRLWQSKPLD
jgi:hypothetical protein